MPCHPQPDAIGSALFREDVDLPVRPPELGRGRPRSPSSRAATEHKPEDLHHDEPEDRIDDNGCHSREQTDADQRQGALPEQLFDQLPA